MRGVPLRKLDDYMTLLTPIHDVAESVGSFRPILANDFKLLPTRLRNSIAFGAKNSPAEVPFA